MQRIWQVQSHLLCARGACRLQRLLLLLLLWSGPAGPPPVTPGVVHHVPVVWRHVWDPCCAIGISPDHVTGSVGQPTGAGGVVWRLRWAQPAQDAKATDTVAIAAAALHAAPAPPPATDWPHLVQAHCDLPRAQHQCLGLREAPLRLLCSLVVSSINGHQLRHMQVHAPSANSTGANSTGALV